jgi:hypothetical protein
MKHPQFRQRGSAQQIHRSRSPFVLTLALLAFCQAASPAHAAQDKGSRAALCSPIEGTWFYSGKGIPVVARGEQLTINMAVFRRPNATGRMISDSQIEVSFPDDATYTGTLDGKGQILWSNGTVWQATQFAGKWYFEGQPGPAVSQAGNRLKVSMASYGRPEARGNITGVSKAQVSFPDDATHTATLVGPNCLQWSNGTGWTK